MDKQRERIERIQKAFTVQQRYFSGAPGSAKNTACGMLAIFREFADMRLPVSAKLAAELQELTHQDMVKVLANRESGFFQAITEIATAIQNRDSHFFRKIANGLDQIPEDIEPMHFIQRAYMHWMCPTSKAWFTIWTLPAYRRYVEQGVEPTKGQLRELTNRFWAIERLTRRKAIEVGCPTEEQSPEIEKKIASEIARLPEQKWARLWKRAGLDNLKAGRPGPKVA